MLTLLTWCPAQVKVLALTDHDTMAGVLEAMESAKAFPIRIIPAVEISAVYLPR
jgi:predicted metal-dependent phosphoesterase TrpH